MPSNDPAIRDHQAWLGYLQPDGLVVSPAALVDAQVLLDRNTLPLQERFLPFVEEVERDDDTILAVTDVARFLQEFLEWPDELLFGLDGQQPLPESLSIPLPEFNETLAPSFAFKDTKPKDPDNPWLMLVQSLPLGVDLDQNPAGDESWKASPSRRFERLLRETKVPIGLLANGTQIRLIYAPKGENSGSITFPLKAMTVADFYNECMQRLRRLGIDIHIWTRPGEIENAIPFDQDHIHAQYDPLYAQRFWLALAQASRVMNQFRARFVGKASPVHFFWGSFDLAVTRFSGRTAPPPKGVTPNLASWVIAEAYPHEVSSCGFWPGNGGYGRAAFYVYAYPEPAGYGDTRLSTAEAFYDTGLGQFILPYDAVRESSDPDKLLLGFLQETYVAAAELAKWDRKALERERRTSP